MRLLLDSHVVLWAIYSPQRLTKRINSLLADPANELIISHASLWELLNKIGRGKLLLAGQSVDAAMKRIADLKPVYLLIEEHQIIQAASLPGHHGDPFDRMLVVHAMEQGIPILTVDKMIKLYEVEVIWE